MKKKRGKKASEKEREGVRIEDLHEKLRSAREIIRELTTKNDFGYKAFKDLQKIIRHEHSIILSEIKTIRESKQEIQDLKEKVKELENK